MKLVGAAILLLGGVAVFWEYSRAQRRQLAMCRDMAAAMKYLSGEIRWKHLTVPQVIGDMCERQITGQVFDHMRKELQADISLQKSWENAVQDFPQEARQELLSMEWGGDMERQEESILYVARRLTELGEEKAGTLHQREKLCAAGALSATGLLVLILI